MSPDVLCLGETMALLAPSPGEPLQPGSALTLGVGGAESNTAVALRGAGVDAAWAGLLGDDPLGDVVAGFLAARDVDISLHERRPLPTGLYVKATGPDGMVRPLYYRRGSAGSTMDAALARRWAQAATPRIVHVSGITAQISEAGAQFLHAVCVDRVFGEALLSFDVNHRPALAGPATPGTLRHLARASDVVFVGADEAQTTWGVAADDIPRHLSGPRHLVVKDAGADASEYGPDGTVRVTAGPATIVDAVGAGDAFAAGWLAALIAGTDAAGRLSEGHRQAARVLASAGDVAPAAERAATGASVQWCGERPSPHAR
ncbi:sugar kinase [Microbacterium sp. zg.Y1084]|uniref:sugar kinase n=1 Tax=Microbacterium sp. zg.Y1084 TaxID=2969667 RepID=UPI00214BADB7|nr:sugar kinase [Microbacterium sp. zg.Y1084]MCR2813824.1 sugar kinase [Microbacterium sp. zg.Y1084]